MSSAPNVLLVKNDFPAKTAQEFMAYVKANPEKLNYASQGPGTTSHLTAELFNKLAGTKLCYYLEMDPRPERGADEAVAFMFEDAVFVRFDVNGTTPVAPGGFMVGSHADDIVAAFGSRVETQPHKYIGAGRYLIVTPEYGEKARLVFEVDGEGRVIEWRIGLPPQVFYVEGCA